MLTIHFKHCRVDYYPEREYAETVFWDGLKVEASPEDTPEYRDSAKEHGYGDDLMAFCLDHEIGHTFLAELYGLPYSPCLRAVALGRASESDHGVEETLVMAVQKRLNEMRCV